MQDRLEKWCPACLYSKYCDGHAYFTLRFGLVLFYFNLILSKTHYIEASQFAVTKIQH